MLREAERAVIECLWQRKLDQEARGLPQSERHRNLEPASAELLCALAAGAGAKRMVELGGSTGISTIALAAAARDVEGRLVSIEIVPGRQAESRQTLRSLGLESLVDYRCEDAASVAPGGLVVADNILSHNLKDYVAHVRNRPGVESITLNIGKGLELTKLP